MKRVKKPKSNTITLKKKDIDQIKSDATYKAMLVCIAFMSESLKLSDDEICDMAVTVDRWCDYLEKHIITINEVSDIIKKQTGLDFGRL